MLTVEESYAYCLRVARTRAKNFYYSFMLLSAQQRKAMCAIYAFMRYCDDLSDEPGGTRAAIDQWRSELESALAGRFGEHPVWPAFHHTVRRFGIPHEYFGQMIDGVAGDLEPRRFEDFAQLYRYCYQVASVVGLTIIHIFGFDTPNGEQQDEGKYAQVWQKRDGNWKIVVDMYSSNQPPRRPAQ